MSRVEPSGLIELRDGLLPLLQSHQGLSKCNASRNVIRSVRDRTPQECDRLLVPAMLLHQVTVEIGRLLVGWVKRHRLLQLFQCLLYAPNLLQMESILEVRTRRLWEPGHGTTGNFERFRVPAGILVRLDGEVVRV